MLALIEFQSKKSIIIVNGISTCKTMNLFVMRVFHELRPKSTRLPFGDRLVECDFQC
jgi:hypothetical protein